MINKLYPDLQVASLTDIPLASLQARQIKALILDLDNTITEWNSNTVHKQVGEWFQNIKQAGFRACILSNNKEQRCLAVAKHLISLYLQSQEASPGCFLPCHGDYAG